MKKVLLALAVSGCTLGMATSAMAQATPAAGGNSLLAGTGLSVGAAGGLLAVVVVLAVAAGGDDGVVTTTTTTGN